MRPARRYSEDNGSQCKVATAALANGSKPFLYMMISTLLLALLCMLFARSLAPEALSAPKFYKSHRVSHAKAPVANTNLMRI